MGLYPNLSIFLQLSLLTNSCSENSLSFVNFFAKDRNSFILIFCNFDSLQKHIYKMKMNDYINDFTNHLTEAMEIGGVLEIC